MNIYTSTATRIYRCVLYLHIIYMYIYSMIVYLLLQSQCSVYIYIHAYYRYNCLHTYIRLMTTMHAT